VEARAIGFRPVRTRVTVDADAPTRVALTVSDAVVVLAPTRVTAPRVQAMLAGFEQRRKGGSGVFFTAEQIAQRRPYSVNDMLIQVPGVQVTFPDGQTPGASPQVVFQRSLGQGGVMLQQCTPTTFIDGVRFAPDISGGIDVLLRPQEVHGIEVYRNLASAPQQFQTLDSSCGVILIWTRRGS
jgi:outer membrane cobalamin receptor